MEWIDSLFTIHSAVQTLVVLALIISVGMALGKLRIRGISLGVASCSSWASWRAASTSLPTSR